MLSKIKKGLIYTTILLGMTAYPTLTNSQFLYNQSGQNSPPSQEELLKQKEMRVIREHFKCFNSDRIAEFTLTTPGRPGYKMNPLKNCAYIIARKDELPSRIKREEKEKIYSSESLEKWKRETQICLFAGISNQGAYDATRAESEVLFSENKNLEVESKILIWNRAIDREIELWEKSGDPRSPEEKEEIKAYFLRKKSNSIDDLAKDWNDSSRVYILIKKGNSLKVVPISPREDR